MRLGLAWPLGQYLGGWTAADGRTALAASGRLMRVLQIVHGFPPRGVGGAELYAESLALSLSGRWGDGVAVLTREHVEDAVEFRVRSRSP